MCVKRKAQTLLSHDCSGKKFILCPLYNTNCIPKFVVVIISFFLKETIIFHPVITQKFGPANITNQ